MPRLAMQGLLRLRENRIFFENTGSVILLVIDLEGLRDAASIINAWRSLDGFAADLLVADFFLALSER